MCDDGQNPLDEGPLAYGPGMNLQCGAQNRVLCAV